MWRKKSQVPNRDLTSMADLHRESFIKASPPRSGPIAIPGAGDSEGPRSNEREEVNLQHSDLYGDEQEQNHLSPEPLKQQEYPCRACQVKITRMVIHELRNQMDSLRQYIDSTLQ